MIPMDENREMEVHKKKLTIWFPLVFLCAVTIIIAAAIFPVLSGKSSPVNGSAVQTVEEGEDTEETVKITAVLKEIDETGRTVELLNTGKEEALILSYTGGTEINDKYEQATVIGQLEPGEMVEAWYSKENGKLVKIQVSSDAWEYKRVEKWNLDTDSGIFKIAESKYQYSQKLVLVSHGEFISLSDLNEKDELTVKGLDKVIWSIMVTKGHGTLRLEDYADFLGGTIYVGHDDILPVTEDMVIPVQEGSFEVILENGNLIGSKQVTVANNEEVSVNLGEYKMPKVKKSKVTFTIKPKGADLYIDDKLTSYNKPVSLEYGEHSVKVVLGGYSAYAGYLEISKAVQTFHISLAEAKENTTDSTETITSASNNQATVNGSTGTGSTINSSDSTEESGNAAEEEETSDTGKKTSGNYVYILQPVGASVYLEGSNYKGQVPVSFPKETGTFHITLIKSGYVTQTYTVEFEDDGEDAILKYDDMEKLNTTD